MLLVSVAYPQQNREIGEGLREAEAALLWVKNDASGALGVSVNRIFLAGHSQGAYVVTRLNTLHPTNGVIANAPGPLDFEYRCLLEERGSAPGSQECGLMVQRYGLASTNPAPYRKISLLSFTEGFKADTLYVQGLDDSAIQMRSWPLFRQAVQACKNCQRPVFLDVAGGHDALFTSFAAREAFNQFIDQRRTAASTVGLD
jgi:pimeloyl-ACP methyl ester carboxylesterase